jgi:hypothetical protein
MPGFAIEGRDRVRRRIRYPRTQRHVWAAAIVMAMPRPQNRSQMGLRDRDEPIQTFAADRANQSFAYGVRFRTRNGRSQHVDSQGLDRIVEVLGKDSISIMDQVTVPSSVPHDFPQLFQSPVGARMRRTLICARRRVLCSITTKNYNIRNVAVTATKKSHARIAFAWFFRKVDQR